MPPLANANITIKDHDTQVTVWTGVTDDNGDAVDPPTLEAGVYDVAISKEGYETWTSTITLNIPANIFASLEADMECDDVLACLETFHTMLVERVVIEEPSAEILETTSTPLVACPKNVRTTIYTKAITVPEGKTDVFISVLTSNDPLISVAETGWIAIDGVDIATKTDFAGGMSLSGWTALLSSGSHTLTIDRLFPDDDGMSACVGGGEVSCVMVCREHDSEYVSFADDEEVTVATRATFTKVIVGVRGLATDLGFYANGYVKATDKFSNEIDQHLTGECPANPVLHEFAFLDAVTLKTRSVGFDPTTAFWISYLIFIYEI